MKRLQAVLVFGCAAAILSLTTATPVEAVTQVLNREVEMNDGTAAVGDDNRPFFTIGGPDGYVGTAVSGGTNSTSTVTNANVGVGGNNTYNSPGNSIPLGVGVNFGVSFTVESTNANHILVDNGNPGLGINSNATQVDSNANELSAGEQLFFSSIQLTNVSIRDPLGLLQPGATIGNPLWSALRSSTFAEGTDAASISSDAAVTTDVKLFGDVANPIGNNYTEGVFSPLSSVYVTTTAGNWPLKGIRYQVPFDYEPAPQPASRRTFQFGENPQPGTYEGQATANLLDTGGNADTTISLAAAGNGALLDTNDIGVGVNSTEDDAATANQQRFINGSLATSEALQFSFDRDVSFESLTVGNLDFGATEGVVLSFVSGTNPFAGGLTGYSGDYFASPTSITFTPTTADQTPYTITYGKNGQQEIIVEAGTVLSVTASPAVSQGFILDMITVNLLDDVGQDGDHNGDGVVDAADYVAWRKDPAGNGGDPGGYDDWRANFGESGGGGAGAVPEPSSIALVLLALVGIATRSPRKA
jgi:hypothetical protein